MLMWLHRVTRGHCSTVPKLRCRDTSRGSFGRPAAPKSVHKKLWLLNCKLFHAAIASLVLWRLSRTAVRSGAEIGGTSRSISASRSCLNDYLLVKLATDSDELRSFQFFAFCVHWLAVFSVRKEVRFEGASSLLPAKQALQGTLASILRLLTAGRQSSEFLQGDHMMGDPGTSDPKFLHPTLGDLERGEFHVQAPASAFEPSEPSFSNNLHGQHPLFLPSLHHHPAVSFRPAGSETWSNRDFEGVSVGARNCAQDPIQNRPSDSKDSLGVMARARVGEGDLFTFPEGEADAVTITASDLARLQPGKFLTDNTVDFYLKYLKVKAISSEHQSRFHFFNSFFFRKLLETTASTGVDEYRVDYLQLQKWFGDVNLFEKDFVFVPIIASSHWSLLVICHLRSLNPSSCGEKKGSPCILHLDPIDGKHESFEGQVKSFILQAWVKRFEASNNLDILHSLFQMKYVQAKVPRQGNGYDCGLYILHYIEVFLSKSTSQELIVTSFEGGAHFTRSNFRAEVFDKRNSIRLIFLQLGGISASYDGNHLSIQPMPQEEDGVVHPGHEHQRSLKVAKELKSKKWKEMETLVLLECVVGGGRFYKGKLGAMHWDLIVEEIQSKNNGGLLRTKEQCQNRFDTLLKAYKDLNAYCLRTGKEFCQVSEVEKRSLKLATPLGEEHEEWYNHLRTICDCRSSLRDQPYKRRKPNVVGGMDVNKLASSPIHPSSQCPLPLDVIGSSKSMKPSSRQVVAQAFNGMEEALRYTFLNLIQVCSLEFEWFYKGEGRLSLEVLCRKLGIIQDQNPLHICNHVYQLQDLKLVTLTYMDYDDKIFGDCWMNKIWVETPDLEVHKKFGRKVFIKNPHLNTVLSLSYIDGFTTCSYLSQKIRVLNLVECRELQALDLEDFPHLCCLYIIQCLNLKVVNGWEASKGLGWIEIRICHSYCDLPHVQFLSSLKEFSFSACGRQSMPWQVANFSHCVQLWRLEIEDDHDLVESMDLKALKVLEVLSFSGCTSLSTIYGLSGLQSLMKLKVVWCKNLKVIPDLGCLKALTHLDMSFSGIIEIPGLEELHLLTTLHLFQCQSLESLPHLGHLKALAYLDLYGSSIEEIPGVEDMVSLETLRCSRSKLKQLPNLDHLCRLRGICVFDTPLWRMDPSRSFIGGYEVIQNDRKKDGIFGDDISDTNDSKDISFDED